MRKRGFPSFNVILRTCFQCIENKHNSFTVRFESINRVLIYEARSYEIEIDTSREVIFGNFRSFKSMNGAFRLLDSALKEKVS